MKHNTEFMQSFMARYDYPEIAVKEFTRISDRLDNEKEFAEKFDAVVENYLFPEVGEIREAVTAIEELAKEYNENECTLDFVFLLNCLPATKERYEKAGIDEQIFWDTFADLKCKLMECIACEEVPGTFVATWNGGFFRLTRFAYGRFQYEISTYTNENDFVTKSGRVLTDGDKYINFHIPSSGIPLTDEVRLDSYRKAYEHYKHMFPDGKVVFGCGSWLLYPRHKEFLPEKSNILKFMSDFEMVEWKDSDRFGDGWRVFGKYSDHPINEWPRDTALRRAFAEWIEKGNPVGNGFGVFVFDGENIVR